MLSVPFIKQPFPQCLGFKVPPLNCYHFVRTSSYTDHKYQDIKSWFKHTQSLVSAPNENSLQFFEEQTFLKDCLTLLNYNGIFCNTEIAFFENSKNQCPLHSTRTVFRIWTKTVKESFWFNACGTLVLCYYFFPTSSQSIWRKGICFWNAFKRRWLQWSFHVWNGRHPFLWLCDGGNSSQGTFFRLSTAAS